jgi:succinate dehydrogenase/fumarate reductase-like Fe-S protein
MLVFSVGTKHFLNRESVLNEHCAEYSCGYCFILVNCTAKVAAAFLMSSLWKRNLNSTM